MISKEDIIKKFSTDKVKDYTYVIVFFVTFSFFAFFVIKPNLTTVFSLEKELSGLQEIDNSYTNVIDKIINIQTAVENTRDTVWVLDEGMPHQPQINQLIEEIKNISIENNIVISKLKISEINLKNEGEKEKYKQIQIDIATESSFEDIYSLILALFKQRRLKTVDNLSLKKSEKASSESANINIKFIIDGYYL